MILIRPIYVHISLLNIQAEAMRLIGASGVIPIDEQFPYAFVLRHAQLAEGSKKLNWLFRIR